MTTDNRDWVLVPREPTHEMIDAAVEHGGAFRGRMSFERAYPAILKAAPPPPTTGDGGLREALRLFVQASEWLGADSYDGIDQQGRELLTNATVAAARALGVAVPYVAAALATPASAPPAAKGEDEIDRLRKENAALRASRDAYKSDAESLLAISKAAANELEKLGARTAIPPEPGSVAEDAVERATKATIADAFGQFDKLIAAARAVSLCCVRHDGNDAGLFRDLEIALTPFATSAAGTKPAEGGRVGGEAIPPEVLGDHVFDKLRNVLNHKVGDDMRESLRMIFRAAKPLTYATTPPPTRVNPEAVATLSLMDRIDALGKRVSFVAVDFDACKSLPSGNHRLGVIEPVSEKVGASFSDTFGGDDRHLLGCIDALLKLDAENRLVPHGIGDHARTLLSAAAARLEKVNAMG